MRRFIITSALVALLAPAVSGDTAEAATWRSCSVGNSGVTYGPYQPARFKSLSARAPMNCASARYVLNKWVRRSYARRGRVPRSFYDGYVTWRCSKRSNLRWQCSERDSGTSFRFTAYRF